jgi:hypothetical protein
VKALERNLERVVPWLFPYFDDAEHVSRRLVGTQRRDFRNAWLTARRKAGYPAGCGTTSGEPPRATLPGTFSGKVFCRFGGGGRCRT